MTSYQDWIRDYEAKHPGSSLIGYCGLATEEMVKVFPELRRVCGFAHVPFRSTEHWWCVTPEGKIVDPTAKQFVSTPQYEEIDLRYTMIRLGKCMNCGSEVMGPMHIGGQAFCLPAEYESKMYDALEEGSPLPDLDPSFGHSSCQESFLAWQYGDVSSQR